MTRQVLNSGLSLTEGVFDKGNLIDLRAVIDRSDANFEELYAASSASSITSSTWAARGSGTATGELKRITDLGPTVGTLVMWDGTYWHLIGATDVIQNFTLATGTTGTSEQILKQITLPAGLLRLCRICIIRMEAAKDGTTDAATAVKVRLGAAGTTSDTQLMTSSNLSAPSRVYLSETWITPTSATNVRLASVTNGTRGWPDTGVTTAFPVDITVADLDVNPLIVSFTVTMAGSTNSAQMAHCIVHMIP
jgi:hypothetical protein